MEINDPYGFVVRRSDDDMQTDHDLVHEHCGTVITRIEPDDNIGTLITLMNEHDCRSEPEPDREAIEREAAYQLEQQRESAPE
jgi:hypothetical protein